MNADKQKAGIEIRQRATQYALRAVKLYRHLYKTRDGIGLVLGKQYLRCATAIGANLVEAQSAETKRDFVHKCGIALKEARESKYWLSLLSEGHVVKPTRLAALFDETDQLVAILTRIIVDTKKNMGTGATRDRILNVN